MALMNCPECGKEISDSSSQCIHCGYVLKQEKDAPVKRQLDKKTKTIIIAVIAIILVLLGVLVVKKSIIPSSNYKKAEEALKNEDFDGAASQFAALGKFKDSEDRVCECYYEKGKSLMAKKSYSAAIKAFEDSKNYEDAANQIDKAEENMEKEEAEAAYQAVVDKLKSAAIKCESRGTELSSDGLTIIVDADDKYDFTSYSDVKQIISTLGLGDALLEEMNHTTAMMGKQTEQCGDYEVSWSYHPDNGLDVIFKVVK